jgi:hypothetical protein
MRTPKKTRPNTEEMKKQIADSEEQLKSFIEFIESPEGRVNIEMQMRYGRAMLERGDLRPEILAKLQRMQELHVKACANKENPDFEAMQQSSRLAAELMPYFHFKVDDQRKQ